MIELPQDFFLEVGEPIDEQALVRIERIKQVRFPTDYRDFLLEYGGGVINSDYSFVYTNPDSLDDNAIEISAIFGGAQDISLYENAIGVAAEWGVPEWGLYFAEGSNPPEDRFLLNLSNPEFPLGSVLYDDEGTQSLVSNSFSELITTLINHSRLSPRDRQQENPLPEKFSFLQRFTPPASKVIGVTTAAEERRKGRKK